MGVVPSFAIGGPDGAREFPQAVFWVTGGLSVVVAEGGGAI
jgi:hypothetical protein